MEIVKVGDPSLLEACVPVENIEVLLPAIQEMKDIINTDDFAGLGLAGPQVGINQTFFVMRENVSRDIEPMRNKKIFAVINPIIKKVYPKTVIFKEGCLSVPNAICYVQRSKEIKVDYTDELGVRHAGMRFKGADAVVFQHEYDHLVNKTILDVSLKTIDTTPAPVEETPVVEVNTEVEKETAAIVEEVAATQE